MKKKQAIKFDVTEQEAKKISLAAWLEWYQGFDCDVADPATTKFWVDRGVLHAYAEPTEPGGSQTPSYHWTGETWEEDSFEF